MMTLLLLLFLADWATLVPAVTHSVPRLEATIDSSKGICSAVVVDLDKDGWATAITAAHCVEHKPTERIDVTLNGRAAYVVDSNALLDLAIVRVHAKKEQPIALAEKLPAQGTEIAIVGYAFGAEKLVTQFGHVALVDEDKHQLRLDCMGIMGDSGGAVVDSHGQLVGIATGIAFGGWTGQMAHLSSAVPIDQVKDYYDNYRERYVKK